jgi:type II secretion system protein N
VDRVRWLTIVGYACAALLLFLVFLYLTLPYEAISRWLVRQAEVAAGVRIRTLSVERLHPLGLRWHGVTVSDPEGGREWVSFAIVSAEPGLPSLLSRRKVIDLEAHLSSGMIEGRAVIGRQQTDGALNYRVDLERIEGVELATFQPFLPAVKELGGRLSGTLSYEWSADQPFFGTGTLYLEAEGVTVGGRFLELLPSKSLRFEQAACGASLAQGRVTISNCTAAGPSGEVAVSGTAQLQSALPQTTLNLRVEATVQGFTPPAGPPTVVTVSGPLGGLQYRMEGGLQLDLGQPPVAVPVAPGDVPAALGEAEEGGAR